MRSSTRSKTPHPPPGGGSRRAPEHNAEDIMRTRTGRCECPGLRPRIISAMFKCPPQRAWPSTLIERQHAERCGCAAIIRRAANGETLDDALPRIAHCGHGLHRSKPASGVVPVRAQNRASGCSGPVPRRVGKNPPASCDAGREKSPPRYDAASESPVAANRSLSWEWTYGWSGFKRSIFTQ